jgi:hypothetical protein
MTQVGQLSELGSVGNPLALGATKMRYPALPVTALQLKAGVVETPVAPFAGALNVGAGRFELPLVVKLKMLDQVP